MKVRETPIGDVRPYPGNPRVNDGAVEAVAASLREFGWQQPIVVDADGTIIAGHTRYKAAKRLGMETVPVVVASELTPEQVQAYRLADNKVGELATWDMGLLAGELDGICGIDMGQFGFEDGDLGAGGLDEAGHVEDDGFDVDSEVPDEPVTRPGDMWLMGDHRLLCGDATDAADVARLMGGEQADMMLTDPPYNIAYEGGTSDRLTIKNDAWTSEADFQRFLHAFYVEADASMRPGAAFYVWHSDMHAAAFIDAMGDTGLLPKQCLVWVKSTFSLGRQDYQWQHEPCLYGWKGGAAHTFLGSRAEPTVVDDAAVPDVSKMRKDELAELCRELLEERRSVPTDVLRERKPMRNGEHPTMKPVGLFARCVLNSSHRGEVVLDPFGGSGTTLVVCEQAGRRCRTLELDPRYCDVIVARWERLTGRKAELAARDV